MMQDMWNAPPGFRLAKSASVPCSPAKPLALSRTHSESFHITHKVPVGDTPYVRAKHVQLVDKDPEKATFYNINLSQEFSDENSLPMNNGTARNQNFPPKPVGSFNVDAQPFYSSKMVDDKPVGGNQFNERLKRTRSRNAENVEIGKKQVEESRKIDDNDDTQERGNKILRRSLEDILPDDKDFEDAIISAVLNTIAAETENKTKKLDVNKGAGRLKVFQDITLSISPRA